MTTADTDLKGQVLDLAQLQKSRLDRPKERNSQKTESDKKENKKPSRAEKVWVVLASYPRNFSLTLPSLLRHSIAPIQSAGRLGGITIATIGVDRFDRASIETAIASSVGPEISVELMFLRKRELARRTDALVASAAQKGNPYARKNPDSLGRSIQFLDLLKFAHESFSAQDMPVVFVRADLYQETNADLLHQHDLFPNHILVPDWHQWHGYNDRVAIVPVAGSGSYFLRLDGLKNYLDEIGMFHPEAFLKHSLRGHRVKEVIKDKFFRTRAGAEILPERFDAGPTFLSRQRYRRLMRQSRQAPKTSQPLLERPRHGHPDETLHERRKG